MGRRGCPPEFRRKVLDLVASGRSVADVARDLGISQESIYTWRRQDRIDAGLAREVRGLIRGSLGRTPVPPAGAWRRADGDEVEGTASAERPSEREVTRRRATVRSVEGSGEPPCSSTDTKTTKGPVW